MPRNRKVDDYHTKDFSHLCGWIDDPVEVSTYINSLPDNQGGHVYSTIPSLQGYWEYMKSKGVTAILWFHVESLFFGKPQPANIQSRGTCVGQGFDRAIQLSNCAEWYNTGLLTLPVDICYEDIYRGSRYHIGGGRVRGDGSVVAWAAKYASTIGCNGRQKFKSVDLSRSNESWACSDGPIPKDVQQEGNKHKIRAMSVVEGQQLMDCIAAGHCVARGHSTLYGTRDSNGMSHYMKPGNHCQCMGGVFVTPDGEDGILEHQSWGENNPGGPRILKVRKGYGTPGAEKGEIEIPSNCYGITLKDWEKARRGSDDAWAVQVDEKSCFPPDKLSKILIGKK